MENLQVLHRNMILELHKSGVEICFGARVSRFHFDTTTSRANGVTAAYSPFYERGDTGRNDTHVIDIIRAGGGGDSDDGKESNTETIGADAVGLATGHSARDVYERLHEDGVMLKAKGLATGFRIEHL